MTAPRVGQPVRGSRSGRPIMVVLDLLGRRGALRVLWELRDAGVIAHGDGGYGLTDAGRALMRALHPLSDWAATWARGAGASRKTPR